MDNFNVIWVIGFILTSAIPALLVWAICVRRGFNKANTFLTVLTVALIPVLGIFIVFDDLQ